MGLGQKSLSVGCQNREAGRVIGVNGVLTAMSNASPVKGAVMNEVLAERNYAWRMIRAARISHADAVNTDSVENRRIDIGIVLSEALEAGLGRTEIIVELADLAARMYEMCNPEELIAAAAEGCLA